MSSEAILRFENISKNINRTEILKKYKFLKWKWVKL